MELQKFGIFQFFLQKHRGGQPGSKDILIYINFNIYIDFLILKYIFPLSTTNCA